MGSESAPSSRASIISIDPAVASQITGTTHTTSLGTHSRTASSTKRTKTPETVSSRGHTRNRSVPLAADKKSPNSLRRAKNSTEVLRQRSTKSVKKPKQLETIPDTREGRNFTIGNVGTGGVLYLKPSAHQNASMQTSPPVLMPMTAPADLPAVSNDENIKPLAKYHTRSDSPSTAVRSTSPRRPGTKIKRRPTIETVRSRHGRSQSFSTLDEQRPPFTGTGSKTLRIVINRPEAAQKKSSRETQAEAPAPSLPTLAVPIPHYRIGTPRFSDHGTPMLRHSIRNSATPSDNSRSDTTVQPRVHGQGPPPASARAFSRLVPAQARAERSEDPLIKTRPQTSDSARTDSTIREPIHPEIYDALVDMYDDPSVVRYSQNVREITAATPARIIAQISSESFMDYELVSDFFLTFRSYMSMYTVLDLLLARLRWAIDRQEDDGRIIRVRTFAALRHWILNYFMDDFVTDRRLRVRFCSEINRMYNDVANRATHGTSDLKVLRDLKRCWNGRCSMYWDPEDFSLDGDQDEDLQPGGLDELVHAENPNTDEDPPPIPNSRMKTYSNSSWFEVPPTNTVRYQHGRQLSNGQVSVSSDMSLQAKSCTIPRNLLRSSPDSGSPEGGSHPVPVQLRRKDAPSNLQVQTNGHRRGAASIDSDREPTPRNPSMTSLQMMHGGSIIRGSVYGPSAPFVQIVSSPSTTAISSFETNNLQSNGTHRGGSLQSMQAPGVKNIFGSLRKALAHRHGHSEMAFVTVSSPIPIQQNQQTQRSPMPLNLSRSHDELRTKSQQAAPRKGQIRIDLLCAQVSQNFDTLFPQPKRTDTTTVTANPLALRSPQLGLPAGTGLPIPDARSDRQPSHTTAQSGSILIVNDTGVVMPNMSGALDPSSQSSLPLPERPSRDSEALQRLQFGLGINHPRSSFAGAATQRSSDALGESVQSRATSPRDVSTTGPHGVTMPLQLESGRVKAPTNMTPPTGSSATMRRGSSQSSVGAGNGQPSIDATVTSVSAHHQEYDEDNDDDDQSDDESVAKFPMHSLRRRPGGDLRKVENVHDLDHATHHESLATDTTASPANSLQVKPPGTKGDVQPPGPKTVSMINTHSSQHLRPSFEAAVAGFSDIPDDDDGGLEATLQKLEGNYDKMSPPLQQHPIEIQRRRSMPEIGVRPMLDDDLNLADTPVAPRYYDQVVVSEQPPAQHDPLMSRRGDDTSSERSSIFGLAVESGSESHDSFDPQPLLQRDTISVPSQSSSGKIMPSPLHLQKGFRANHGSRNELQEQPEPRESLQRPLTAAESNQSFLLDEDENLSDLSSEISVDIINYNDATDRSFSPMLAAPGTALSGLEIPSHPLTYASVVNLAPPTEIERESTMMRESQLMQNGSGNESRLAPPPNASRTSGGPAHIPFILACDSQVLAQQLTLIEKSALTEIQWSDLVDRRWDNNSVAILDWAELLAKGDVQGVDLVVARFNLVSKWVRSEIVLTQDIEERAQVIAKYIHVAAHARRLHNYATMVQVTMGLTSTDCTRLNKTWEKVPEPDRSLLKNMERLVQPLRNFHELRLEIDSADMSDGCIPFLGLYIQDLTYNAQKPAQIATRRGSEPLINFERFRTAAVVVKGLLQLIDASARYVFEPQKGIIERCLWLATLSEERIYTLSRSLER